MRISSTDAIEGGRVLYTIGRIEAASTWHPADGSPMQENWRELVLRELIHRAEDIDADAVLSGGKIRRTSHVQRPTPIGQP